jgi:two-component system cell cycle sensor histidine kinase/response regulator CckA
MYAIDDERVLQTGDPIINREEPFDDINGEQGWFLTSKYPLRDSNGAILGLVGTCRNVTEKRRADLALADEREKLRTILDAVQDPVFVKDLQGRHIMRNAAGMRLFGRTPESGDRTVYELPMPREYADLYTKDDRTVLETGMPIVNREEPFLLPDGAEGYLLTSKSPLRDGAGRIVGLVGISRDITQMRKDAKEREALHAKLRETQKLESLGLLAGGIAHDFNNLLTSILGHASIAALDLPPGSPVHDCIEQITEASMRAADLCKQMLAYSGRGRFHVQKLDLGQLVEQTAQMLQISISKKAVLRFRLEKRVLPVEVDATQIRQVIMNLVINASEAIGEKSGVINISTGLTQVDRAYLAATLVDQRPAGRRIRFPRSLRHRLWYEPGDAGEDFRSVFHHKIHRARARARRRAWYRARPQGCHEGLFRGGAWDHLQAALPGGAGNQRDIRPARGGHPSLARQGHGACRR